MAIAELATQYGRHGYRRVTALLKPDGWQAVKECGYLAFNL